MRRLGALHLFLLEISENLSVILDYFFTLFESAVIKFTRMFFPIYKSKSNSKLFKYEYNIYDNVQKIFLWERFWTYHHKIRISGKISISTILLGLGRLGNCFCWVWAGPGRGFFGPGAGPHLDRGIRWLRGFPTVWKVFLKVFYRKTVRATNCYLVWLEWPKPRLQVLWFWKFY